MAETIIRPAQSDADYAAFGANCRAYVAWCRARYADMPWFIDEVFGFQEFDAEQGHLRKTYGPPDGVVMVAERDGIIIASGAGHRLDAQTYEIKRVFLHDDARGHGLGRRLTEALIAWARHAGYRAIRLDTTVRHNAALALYARLGFVRVAPYVAYPAHLLEYFVFMELAL